MQQLWDQQVALSFLLDLDWTIPYRLQVCSAIREKALRELRRVVGEGALGAVLGTTAELRSELAVAENKVRRLREQLVDFRVVPQYEELEKQASSLTAEINELADRNTADRQLVEQLERALAEERPPEFDASVVSTVRLVSSSQGPS